MPASSSLIAGPTFVAILALVAAVAPALAGCASSPPATAASVARQQHALAVARAAEYCRSKGLAMRAGADGPTRPGQAATDFPFRCVKER